MGRPPRAIPASILPTSQPDIDDTFAAESDSAGSMVEDLFGTEQENLSCWIHKYENLTGTKMNLRYRKDCEIPSLEQIYDSWGPGKYWIQIKERGGKNRIWSKVREIGDNFMGRRPRGNEIDQMAGSPAAVDPFAQMDSMLTIFERMSVILAPKQQPQGPEGMLNMMGSVMNLSQGLMTDAIKTNAKLAGDAQREIMAMRRGFNEQIREIEDQFEDDRNEIADAAEGAAMSAENADIPVSEATPVNYQQEMAREVIKVFEPLIEEHLSKIIGEGPQSKLIIAAIKGTELYQKFMGAPQAVEEVRQWVKDEYPAESEAIIEKFDIK